MRKREREDHDRVTLKQEKVERVELELEQDGEIVGRRKGGRERKRQWIQEGR